MTNTYDLVEMHPLNSLYLRRVAVPASVMQWRQGMPTPIDLFGVATPVKFLGNNFYVHARLPLDNVALPVAGVQLEDIATRPITYAIDHDAIKELFKLMYQLKKHYERLVGSPNQIRDSKESKHQVEDAIAALYKIERGKCVVMTSKELKA